MSDERPPHLQLVDDGAPTEELAADSSPPTLEEMWEAVPLNVQLADGIDVDDRGSDPALEEDGKRRCIAERRAGGRCTAAAPAFSLLCNAHSGRLDASAGGRARAEALRQEQLTEAERARLARLGPRGVIADTLAERPALVRKAVLVLLEDAAAGDRVAAKALIPYLNQGLGMPTETVQVQRPETTQDLEKMDTADLAAFIASRRAEAAQ